MVSDLSQAGRDLPNNESTLLMEETKNFTRHLKIKGVPKKMSLAQNLKVSFPKNQMSQGAVLLTIGSTHEYYKL